MAIINKIKDLPQEGDKVKLVLLPGGANIDYTADIKFESGKSICCHVEQDTDKETTIENRYNCPKELWDLLNEEQRRTYDSFAQCGICPVCKGISTKFDRHLGMFICSNCGTNIEPYKTCLGG